MNENSSDKRQEEQMLAYARDLATVYQSEKEKRHQLEVTNIRMRLVLNNIDEPIVSLDSAGIINEANIAFSLLVDRPLDQIHGQPLSKVLPGSHWQELLTEVESASIASEIAINPDRIGFRHFRAKISPLPDTMSGRRVGTVFILIDETKRLRNENLKSELLSLVSHEILTPVTVISGYTSLIEEAVREKLSDTEKEYFGYIDHMVSRLTRTVREIAEISRLAVGTHELRQLCSLKNSVVVAINRCENRAKDRDVTLTIELPESDCVVQGYPELLSDAVEHVLDNAITFTARNTHVDISIGEFQDMWTVDIIDRGKGMTREEMDAAVELFHQTEHYLTRSHEGIGLGLSITERIAHLHRGQLLLQRATTGGLHVILTMPKGDASTTEDSLQTPQKTIVQLNEKIEMLNKQNIQYAEDLASTYSEQRRVSRKLKKTELQLIRSEKLGIMGQMIAGIAHELNNMLNPIVGYSDLLLRKQDLMDAKMVRWVESIKEAAWRAASFLSNSLDFSRQTGTTFVEFDIVSRIQKTLQFLEFRLRKSNARLVTDFQPERITILGIPGEMDQVFTNFIINAIDAMEGIKRNHELAIRVKIMAGETEKGQIVVCDISDTGCGIEPENVERVFEPFFSTKQEGKGTGMGMFIAHNIIEKHGGTISITSKRDSGTTFTLTLPAHE